MALASQILAQGQLAASKTTMYTATGECAITQIFLCNTDGSTRTINIYVKKASGTSRQITAKNHSMATLTLTKVLDNMGELRLGNGDIIEGDASAATVVDYTICGGA